MDLNRFRLPILIIALAMIFVASPASGDVTLIHWSDIHCGAWDYRSTFRKDLVTDMNTMPEKSWPAEVGGGKIGKIDFVIATGDITDHGFAKEWDDHNDWIGDDYLSLRNLIKFPSYEAMGNHDTHNGGAEAGIKALHKNTYYSWETGGIHFVSLDEYVGGGKRADNPDIDPAQLDWLEKDLKKVNKGVTPVVLFLHSPPVRRLGKHWTTIGNSVDRLTQILEGHKALFLHGHWHKSMLNDLDGMWVIGAGCSMNPKYTKGAQVNEYN
ncbi:MAG TPA: metallophosphoesterase, partial [Tepidisphaeraceae bacterium]|nr:metallophosphoesterase [Tepidisphaeraceae bacterium]